MNRAQRGEHATTLVAMSLPHYECSYEAHSVLGLPRQQLRPMM